MGDAYISIDQAPLDPYLVPDQGDQGHPAPALTLEHLEVAKTAPTPIVPFTRTLELGSVGKDVIGAKRAIWKATGLKVPARATQTFGPTAVKQLRLFQKQHGLTVDGELGPATLKKLGPFFDAYAFLLYVGYPPGGTKEQQQRNAIVAYAVWGYNNRAAIHYSEIRPMQYMDELEHLPVYEDCSTFVTKAYKFAAAPDPNGLGYNGAGNTTTLREHGRVVAQAQAQDGDLPQYQDPDHTNIYVGDGRVISLGSEIGPLLQPINYRPLYEIRAYL
jgi:peptidoglycan hydrolase-like protein with peptidoglycan-binding domain